jgi:cytochrome c biogenesis protein CcmG/thiol:disulfide interchange protein DsbE
LFIMRFAPPALIVAALSASVLFTAPAQAADAGQAAPELAALPTASGGAISAKDLQGKVTYLDFWASWCGPCKQSFPWMNQMQAKYGSKGFQVIAVNLDKKRDDADRFLAEVPAKFSVAFDAPGASAKQFQIKGMPSSVLIGADGRVIATHSGFRDDERAELEARISAALGAK